MNIKNTIAAINQMQAAGVIQCRILQSKSAFRQRLAARPIEEKLAMLDALRARAIALRESRPTTVATALREEPPGYQTKADASQRKGDGVGDR